jgi:GH24 family phage-related lysozyme (muramidase)
MADFANAIAIIRQYEGFNEKAYPHFETGGAPYTLGYGTQFYPDGSPVQRGQRVTKEKALEYLKAELEVISDQLAALDLILTNRMEEALISFIHSIGWDNFLYCSIIDDIELGDLREAAQAMQHWVFDAHKQAVGSLLQRRKEECRLFLEEDTNSPVTPSDLLLAAFRNYDGRPHQVTAIRRLEISLSPYLLSEFSNEYRVLEHPGRYYPPDYS